MAVITVSRGLGAGGEAIAIEVALALHVPYLDREIIRAVADQAGVAEEALRDTERVPGLLDRMLSTMASATPDIDLNPWPYTPGLRQLDAMAQYRLLIEQFIRTIADSGPAVIVGHGATAILAGHPRVLRCLFAAPIATRVTRVMAQEGIDRKAAERRIEQTDKAWRDFLKTYYGIEWTQPRHYDLIINTDRIDLNAGVDLVIRAARAIDSSPSPVPVHA
jgi:cytidylate kinase